MRLLVLFLSLITISGSAMANCSTATMGTKPEGYVFHNADYDVIQICVNGQWEAVAPLNCPDGDRCDPCHPSNSPSPGTTCLGGSIYAGLSPDGNVPMLTTSADAPSDMQWSTGNELWDGTDMINCTDASPGTAVTCQTGEANTALLTAATAEPDYPFIAAEYCDDLSAHGYNDWYLPAQDELNMLYTYQNWNDLSGTFSTGYYWSSSEESDGRARTQRILDGTQDSNEKSDTRPVRCVRKY